MTQPSEREIGQEMVASLHHSSGSFELVLGAVIAGLVGFGIDRLVGSAPVFTILFAVAGLVGATTSILISYRMKMTAAEQARTAKQHGGSST